MKNFFYLLLFALPAVFGLNSFKIEAPKDTIAADTVCYTRDIQPLLTSNCTQAKCHDAITNEAGFNLTTYAGVMEGIKPNSIANSSIYNQVNLDKMPEKPYAVFTASQKLLLKTWIEQGAKNTPCESGNCDSTKVTYEANIKPIFEKNCVGCHSVGIPGGGIDLRNPNVAEEFKVKIYGASSHSLQYVVMPPTYTITDCEIAMLKKWAGLATDIQSSPVDSELQLSVKTNESDIGSIRFTLPREGSTTLALYSLHGKELLSIANRSFEEGSHLVNADLSQLQRGVYLVRLTSNGKSVVAKLLR